MKPTHTGYIAPLLLVVVLLGLGGFFLFAGQGTETPVAENTQPTSTPTFGRTGSTTVTSSDDDVDADDDSDATAGDDDSDDVPAATSTASTTLDISAELE